MTGGILKERARALGLYGLVNRWDDIKAAEWLEPLLEHEEHARRDRSFERRRAAARLPGFKPISDFDWQWSRSIDRPAVETLIRTEFIHHAGNAVLVGGQGVGKTMIAANIGYHALQNGYTVRFEKAADLLETLAEIPVRRDLHHRIALLARPRLLILDEIGYVTLDSRHADILYAIVSRRYQRRSTLVTTTLGFAQWHHVFPSASGIAGTVDRLMHNATLISIDSDSWRAANHGVI